MKVFKSILFFSALVLLSCERDDICAESTPTTPRLLIEFYDDSDPETLKSVTRLTAYGEGLVVNENGDPIEPTSASSATIAYNSNENSLSLPLQIGTEDEMTTTRFILESNTNFRVGDENPATVSNVDIFEISYTPQFEYVSRACGYKSIFTNIIVRRLDDDDNWISSTALSPAIIETQTVENENEVHVFIFH